MSVNTFKEETGYCCEVGALSDNANHCKQAKNRTFKSHAKWAERGIDILCEPGDCVSCEPYYSKEL